MNVSSASCVVIALAVTTLWGCPAARQPSTDSPKPRPDATSEPKSNAGGPMPERSISVSVPPPEGAKTPTSVTGVIFRADPTWELHTTLPMRVATYVVPPPPGLADKADLSIAYFGPEQGGTVAMNMTRWVAQFDGPDGSKPPERQWTREVGDMVLHRLSTGGTLMKNRVPGGGFGVDAPGLALEGAILEGPKGLVFVKLLGPQAVVDALRDSFDRFLDTATPADREEGAPAPKPGTTAGSK